MNPQIISFLEKYDEWYSKNKQMVQQEYQEYQKESSHFLSLFGTRDQLEQLTFGQYVFQTKGNPNSLCFLIDFGTNRCGINRGPYQSGYQRYGIQLQEDGVSCYPFCKGKVSKYGDNPNAVFNHFKDQIIKLFDFVAINDSKRIESSIDMPAQFTNKLHFIYSGNKSIPIYTNNHCKLILSLLGIELPKNGSTFQLRQMLYGVLLSFNRVDITPWHFMKFVYSEDGYKKLLKPRKTSNTSLRKVERNIVNKKLNIHTPVHGAPEDIDTTEIGKLGEKIAFDYLDSHRNELRIKPGSQIVKLCELQNTIEHCDFKYETTDGQTMYIEVKATSMNRPNEYHFKMSAYEYNFMIEHRQNYVIYYINDVYHNNIIEAIMPDNIIDKLYTYTYYMNGKLD